MVIERALVSGIKDFEDAVLDESGKLAGADAVITRNDKDFVKSTLKVFTPHEFLELINH